MRLGSQSDKATEVMQTLRPETVCTYFLQSPIPVPSRSVPLYVETPPDLAADRGPRPPGGAVALPHKSELWEWHSSL